MVCILLSVEWCIQKFHCCKLQRIAQDMMAAGFLLLPGWTLTMVSEREMCIMLQ